MKRILFVSTPYVIGGAERLACTLTRELTRRGWQAELIFPEPAQDSGVLEWCERQGVPAQATPRVFSHDGGRYGRRDFTAFRNLIIEKRPDIVNVHYGDNFLSLKDALAIRSAGCSDVVMSVHNTSPWDMRVPESRRKRRMTRSASFLCRAIVANSSATERVLRDADIAEEKLHCIWCGVTPPTPPLTGRTAARQAAGIAPETFVIGAMARLVETKGIQFLLRAFAAFRTAHPAADVLLLLGGDGVFRPALEALAHELLPPSSIRFLGTVHQIDGFYPACDIIALPSLQEGFGMVFVEAAYYGVPSVGSRIDGVPEVVLDGATGLLIPPGDVPELTAALETLYANPTLRSRLGEAARTRACREFTDVAMVDRYERLFLHQPEPDERKGVFRP